MLVSGVYFQNCLAAIKIGRVYDDLTIKAAGAKQGSVENLRTVSSGQNNNAGVGLKTIHLNQQSIKGLLTLVVDRTYMDTSLAADSVKFINEYDTGRMLLRLLEQIAHSSRADSHKHFYEIAAAN